MCTGTDFLRCSLFATTLRPIEESLREFDNMRKGKYAANQATLRMKMDMLSPNPNMWDQVRNLFILFYFVSKPSILVRCYMCM